MYPVPFAAARDVVRVALEAEQLGYYDVAGNDHLSTQQYVREAWTTPPCPCGNRTRQGERAAAKPPWDERAGRHGVITRTQLDNDAVHYRLTAEARPVPRWRGADELPKHDPARSEPMTQPAIRVTRDAGATTTVDSCDPPQPLGRVTPDSGRLPTCKRRSRPATAVAAAGGPSRLRGLAILPCRTLAADVGVVTGPDASVDDAHLPVEHGRDSLGDRPFELPRVCDGTDALGALSDG